MTEPCRDDAPEQFSLTRRTLVIGGVLLTGGLAAAPRLLAQSGGQAAPEATPKFMELSSLLIDHHLDAEIGARLAVAMTRLNPAIEQQIDGILAIARTKKADGIAARQGSGRREHGRGDRT